MPLRDNAPSYDVPGVTLLLVALTGFAYFVQFSQPGGIEHSLALWAADPQRVLQGGTVPGTSFPAWLTLLTQLFLHTGFGHFFGNIYALWLFGDNIEWLMGRARFLLFYLFSGVAAGWGALLLAPDAALPLAGANGAVTAVMTAYLLMYPRARITMLTLSFTASLGGGTDDDDVAGLTTCNISSLWVVGGWVVLQLVLAMLQARHAALSSLDAYVYALGIVAGLLLIYPLALKSRLPAADAPQRSDPLTDPLFGEDGDAGGGEEPVAMLEDEVKRLHALHLAAGHVPGPEEHFRDALADELWVRREHAAALEHCRCMLAAARACDDSWRVQGYLRQIDQLREALGDFEEQPPEAERLRRILDQE